MNDFERFWASALTGCIVFWTLVTIGILWGLGCL
jgi:hypothetical protein